MRSLVIGTKFKAFYRGLYRMQHKGLIQVYCGNGKGKTTAALGTALRAAGQGFRVLILQFMKKKQNIGEVHALASAGLPIELKQYGTRLFFKSRACELIDILKAREGLKAFKKSMESRAYDMIILDEINIAVDFGLLDCEEVCRLIASKPPELHLILTGRNTPIELIELADLVTEMKEVKHPYNLGIPAQKGVEY